MLTSGALYENEYIKVGDEWKVLSCYVITHQDPRDQIPSCVEFNIPISQTPIGFVKFVSDNQYPESPGGPDEIERPGDRTVWLWPDGNFNAQYSEFWFGLENRFEPIEFGLD